ncbi:MAG: anaerobic ribonucleoside-triphosphate reductase activating protein [Candidatus Diapherotrites archaeon]|uniref:Anaerobic ribonucleoside-triphosphate reductase activating protein n=1 Tax=Candidatus Iainarchaeum sp. TaxID=3101447 RepID=A0A938YS55_9ARCH|nr:anaerobic ribonucleoside-triphosphate reductase activating protein [Candidatus Diapherotrites archaeon]
MLVFKGIQKTTLIDFPGKVACTLFLPKCNFRCPFCYNAQLVLEKDTGISITEKEVFDFLDERKGFLDGICITGGEPLMHPSTAEFCKKVKEKGLLVKVDSNGSFPKVLKRLVEESAVDYIAMDIKASRENYAKAAGVNVDLTKIDESIGIIRKSGIEYEFRMTAIPSLHSKDDIVAVGKWLNGSKRFFLQQFNPDVPLLDSSLQGSKTYTKGELLQFSAALKPFFEEVAVRGI